MSSPTIIPGTGLSARARARDESAELLVRGGTVIDGTGAPARAADVLIRGDRIARVAPNLSTLGQVLDATGLTVTPGFVDPHTHSDLLAWLRPRSDAKLRQGVTTEVVGNCGFSFAPLSETAARYVADHWEDIPPGHVPAAWTWTDYLAALEAAGPPSHVAALVGHHALRLTAGAESGRSPTGATSPKPP